MQNSGVDIKKKGSNQVTPTPNNTPLGVAQFPSSSKPGLSTMQEEGDDNDSGYLPNLGLMNLLENKLGGLVGKKSGYIKSLPEPVQSRISGLKGLQHKTHQLETQFHSEFFELEKKYAELFKPLFEERSSIVNGLKEPETGDVDLGKQIREEEEADDEEPAEETTKSTETFEGVPEFWLTIFKNHPSLVEVVTDKDEEALKHLMDVSIRYLEDEPGYCLDFTFSANPFFTNSVLTKKYFFSQTEKTGEFIIESAEGTEIQWKEGKDLTKEVHHKKQIHKVTQETRIVTKENELDSFFKYFHSLDLNQEEIDSEDPLQNPESDYQLGETFRESLIPHAVDWFTGIALEYDAPFPDQFGDQYDEDEEDFEEEEEEDFDEED